MVARGTRKYLNKSRGGLKIATAVPLGGLMALVVVSPVQAKSADVLDATSVITQIAPHLVSETSDQTEIDVTNSPQRRSLDGSVERGVRVDVADLMSETTGESLVASGVEFTIDYVSDEVSSESRISTLVDSSSEELAAYVQPTPSGVRVLTAVGSEDQAAESFSYTFDVPAETELQKMGEAYFLIGPDGESYGSLAEPWARDASGVNLETIYTWDAGTLTQHVVYPSDVSYPVLLDPNWNYSHDYFFGTYGQWAPEAGLYDVELAFHDCFDCLFPLPGAPTAFPDYLEVLPLYMSVGISGYVPFECDFHGEFIMPGNHYGFQFNATRNHMDGLGSMIMFYWVYGETGFYQYVSAHIVNDFPAHLGGNTVMAAAAKAQWQILFNNVKGRFD